MMTKQTESASETPLITFSASSKASVTTCNDLTLGMEKGAVPTPANESRDRQAVRHSA